MRAVDLAVRAAKKANLFEEFFSCSQAFHATPPPVTQAVGRQKSLIMSNSSHLESLSKITESILHFPFEWCHVEGGNVILEDATKNGGTKGGTFQVDDFAIAKYPITNAQYERFLKHSNGFSNTQWWEYSTEATQWRKDHKNPKPTAFNGSDLPRTRVSWFDSMAFCLWLSTELENALQDGKHLNIRIYLHGLFVFPQNKNGNVRRLAIAIGVILGAML